MGMAAIHRGKGPMRENVVDVLYKGLTITNTLLAWAGKKVTRRDLAEKTGLASKQVSRYLNTLEALHFPLTRERRGTEELVTFERGTSHPVRLLPFTTEELAAVAFYTSLSPAVQDTPLGVLHTACQKIADFLQEDLALRPQLREAFLAFAKHAKVYSTPQVESVLHALLPRTVKKLMQLHGRSISGALRAAHDTEWVLYVLRLG